MKPGKPLTFATVSVKRGKNGTVRPVLIFGLPGNPVSCIVCFHLAVVPALRKLSGIAEPHLRR